MTLQVISLNQSFASYFMHGLTAISSLLSLEWNELIWDLGPNIRDYSHIHSNKKLVIHFLSVTWEFLITEWFSAAICYNSIKQIIYSQVIKITKKQENVSDARAALCMISTNGETDPPWKHLYLRSPQDSHTSLPGQVVLHWKKGVSVSCGSAPGCEVDGSLTWLQLWLQFSKALKSHWLCFSETHLGSAVAELHLGLNTMVVLIFQGMLSVLSIY